MGASKSKESDKDKEKGKENMKPNQSSATVKNLKKRSTKDANISVTNSKQPKSQKRNEKTAMSRPHHPNNRNHRNNQRKKSSSALNSISPQTQNKTNQSKIDQYSLSLQIKNSECELLKNENKELKNSNNELRKIEKEHSRCTQKILHLNEESVQKTERISKLERKLESCGIDPIALESPQFMNEDTQKNIIFWRQRLYKAREKMNAKKAK